jgi:hypothetical protein
LPQGDTSNAQPNAKQSSHHPRTPGGFAAHRVQIGMRGASSTVVSPRALGSLRMVPEKIADTAFGEPQ